MHNCFWDAVRYGSGLTITSGATDEISLEDIFAIDDSTTYKYGVVQKAYGAYVITGKLIFGDASGTGSIDFVDKNQIVLFPDNDMVADTFYGISVVGNGTGTTNFTLGEESGGSGISGCTIKSVGGKTFSLDVSDSDNDVIGLLGCSFINAGVITLPTIGTGRKMLNCNLNATDGVIVSTCEVAFCNFIAADDEAVILSSISHQLRDSNFIANLNAIRITVAETYSFDNLKFIGNTTDIDNTSGGAVTVNCSNGSNPTTETNDTTIVNSVTLTLTGLVAGSDVVILEAGTSTELVNIDANPDSDYAYVYTYAAEAYIDVGVFKAGYVPFYV
ncbi:MAG: hypothetical protein LC687_03935, partial [Actinobacteria bacterium]|nr:hypothetical protein [Actinomycetota bacterium]